MRHSATRRAGRARRAARCRVDRVAREAGHARRRIARTSSRRPRRSCRRCGAFCITAGAPTAMFWISTRRPASRRRTAAREANGCEEYFNNAARVVKVARARRLRRRRGAKACCWKISASGVRACPIRTSRCRAIACCCGIPAQIEMRSGAGDPAGGVHRPARHPAVGGIGTPPGSDSSGAGRLLRRTAAAVERAQEYFDGAASGRGAADAGPRRTCWRRFFPSGRISKI